MDETTETGETVDESAEGAAGLFEEIQQPWWVLTPALVGTTAAGAVAATWSAKWVTRLGVAGVAAAGVGLALYELAFPMKTTLLPEEIQVRFGKRTRFRVPVRNIVRAYPRVYDPIREYGGWGIRMGLRGRAFNMRGNNGVQLVLRSGTRLLIGSQRPEELAEAICQLTGCFSTPDE